MIDDEQMKARAAHRATHARITCFSSLAEENAFERRRRSGASLEARRAEVKALEDRVRGPGWEKRPIEKVWSFELVDWYPGRP